jgi:4'-phosphopantetheinyl transferase
MGYTTRRSVYVVARCRLKLAVATAYGWDIRDLPALARIEARHAPDGAPELYVDGAPAGQDVSLTDRAGWAVCVVTPPGTAPGVDLELVEPRTEAFVRDYLTDRELAAVRAAVAASGPQAIDLVANLMWSAKESALKVLRTGLRRDTRSVEVTVEDLGAPERTWSPLSVRTVEGETFPGWWRRTGGFVLTVCSRAPFGVPESLEDPPALDTGEPLHSWLARPTG